MGVKIEYWNSSFTKENPNPFCQDPLDKLPWITQKQFLETILSPRTEKEEQEINDLIKAVFEIK